MILQVEKKYYSLEDYLELETQATDKHEYRDGEIVLMTGGTPNHNKIILNFGSLLNFALKRQPYTVFVADQRLWIPQKRAATYPDVMVVQGELQFQEGRKDTITNPILVAEVLSKSTQAYDQGEKFKIYRTIPNLQEYLLIDQYSLHVEQYSKIEPQRWIFSEYEGESASFSLSSISLEVSLADIYDKVDFTAESEG